MIRLLQDGATVAILRAIDWPFEGDVYGWVDLDPQDLRVASDLAKERGLTWEQVRWKPPPYYNLCKERTPGQHLRYIANLHDELDAPSGEPVP